MSKSEKDEKFNPFDRRINSELKHELQSNNLPWEEVEDKLESLHDVESTNNQLLPAILNDLDVPKQTKGPFDHVTRERWLCVIEHLLVRGVKSGREVSRMTGLSVPTAAVFINEIKDNLSKDLTVQKVNITREILYAENEVIADFCWNLIQEDPTSNRIPSLLKIIGDTNQRRSRLYGLENIQLNVSKAETTVYDAQTQQKIIADKLGINASGLSDMAKLLASQMHKPSDEKNIIEAEFSESNNDDESEEE